MPEVKTGATLQFSESCLQKMHCHMRFSAVRTSLLPKSRAATQAVLHGVATLKARKGAFDALNKGSGAVGKVK